MNDEYLKLDKQICFRLYRASRKMIRLYKPILESMNITYPQYVTMLVMWENGVVDSKELGEKLDLKTGTLTPIVKRLENLGYVERERNPDDNRRVWVKITEFGRKQKHNALKIPQLLNSYMNLDLNQYQRYVALLDELGEVLDAAEKKQKEGHL
jgi:DNA-binding MarR family transcriptional regulator